MARRILDHKCGVLNEALELEAQDEPGNGNANHVYDIGVPDKSKPDGLRHHTLRFQNGGCKEVGQINGISNEVLIAVVIDRMRGFQRGPFRCRENLLALTLLEGSLHWLQQRNKKRAAAGVEGVSVQMEGDGEMTDEQLEAAAVHGSSLSAVPQGVESVEDAQ